MIELTEQQRSVLDGTNPLPVHDPEIDKTYVLVQKEEFDRLLHLLDADTVYTTAEMLDEVMAEDDAKDPYLADIQKNYGRFDTGELVDVMEPRRIDIDPRERMSRVPERRDP